MEFPTLFYLSEEFLTFHSFLSISFLSNLFFLLESLGCVHSVAWKLQFQLLLILQRKENCWKFAVMWSVSTERGALLVAPEKSASLATPVQRRGSGGALWPARGIGEKYALTLPLDNLNPCPSFGQNFDMKTLTILQIIDSSSYFFVRNLIFCLNLPLKMRDNWCPSLKSFLRYMARRDGLIGIRGNHKKGSRAWWNLSDNLTLPKQDFWLDWYFMNLPAIFLRRTKTEEMIF